MRITTRPPDTTLAKAPPTGRRARPFRVDSRTKKLSALSSDVQRLLLDVARLEQLHALLREKTMSRADSATGSLSKIVRTYFDVFAHGFQPSVRLPDGRVLETVSFISNVMDDDLVCAGFRGWEILLENMKRFNAVFNNMELRLTDLKVVALDETDNSDGRVFATATVTHTGYVTLKTIEILFPHVLSDAGLVMSILGRPVSGNGRTMFTYDTNTGRIISCFIDIDMVGTFATVVTRPSDLALLFKMAQITPEGYIGDRDTIPADKANSVTLVDSDRMTTREAMGMKTLLSSEDDADDDDSC